MIVCHFHDDDEGGDRGLGDAGEIGDHAENDGRACGYVGEKMGDICAESCTCGKRGRHDAAGNAADIRNHSGHHFQQPVGFRQDRLAVKQCFRLAVSAAVRGIV